MQLRKVKLISTGTLYCTPYISVNYSTPHSLSLHAQVTVQGNTDCNVNGHNLCLFQLFLNHLNLGSKWRKVPKVPKLLLFPNAPFIMALLNAKVPFIMACYLCIVSFRSTFPICVLLYKVTIYCLLLFYSENTEFQLVLHVTTLAIFFTLPTFYSSVCFLLKLHI